MKFLLFVGLLFTACLLQAEARSIVSNQAESKILADTNKQALSCAKEIGPQVQNLPEVEGIEQLPEDNDVLNQLMGCVWAKKGIIDVDDAEVDADKLEAHLVDMFTIFQEASPEVVGLAHEIAVSCRGRQANDYGLRAVRIQNCVNGHLQDILNAA